MKWRFQLKVGFGLLLGLGLFGLILQQRSLIANSNQLAASPTSMVHLIQGKTAIVVSIDEMLPTDLDQPYTIIGKYSGQSYTYIHSLDAQLNVRTDWFDSNQQSISYETFLAQEHAAYWKLYGNFDQALIAELGSKQANDEILVSIWLHDEGADKHAVIDELNRLMSKPYQFTQGQVAPTLSATLRKADLELLQWQPSIDRIYPLRSFDSQPEPLR